MYFVNNTYWIIERKVSKRKTKKNIQKVSKKLQVKIFCISIFVPQSFSLILIAHNDYDCIDSKVQQNCLL